LRDFLLKHEVVGKYLKFETHHVIDMNMEYDKGLENPYFPEYRTRLSRFFNTDTNTTTGFYKFGDLETGAIVTVHFIVSEEKLLLRSNVNISIYNNITQIASRRVTFF
jgi:hypothetical protein